MIKKLMMMVAAVAAAVGAWADTWTDPDTGYTWTYRITGVYPFFDCQSASHPDK